MNIIFENVSHRNTMVLKCFDANKLINNSLYVYSSYLKLLALKIISFFVLFIIINVYCTIDYDYPIFQNRGNKSISLLGSFIAV